jgi:predicted DNA-binding ribbon-helix-helix protein
MAYKAESSTVAVDLAAVDVADTGEGPLDRMFGLCNPDQAREYEPERRSFRIHGHSTTIRLERAFWSVLEELAADEETTVSAVITKIYDHCLQANEKNLASCLRVVCLKYINVCV